MMADKMVPLCTPTRISSAQERMPQTEHPRTGVEEEYQARALSTQSLSEGLPHPPSLESWPPLLLRDAFVPIPEPVLVVAQLS